MFKESAVRGFKKGINTTWELAKIVVPVYFFVTFLKYTPMLEKISTVFEPAMNILGLPGEASIVLVVGNVINLYAGVGAIAGLALTKKQVTILAVMLSFSHSLFLETTVAKRTGVKISVILAIRIGLAICSGVILNLIL